MVRPSSFSVALIAAGVGGIILGLVGAHTGNPTVGEQKWYWLVSGFLTAAFGWLLAVPRFLSAQHACCSRVRKEVVDLPWQQVDFKTANMTVRRVKNGTEATHPLTGRELRELRRHQRESPPSPFVFVSERGAPLSAAGFARMPPRRRTWASRRTRTCCAAPVAISSRMTASTPDRCKPIWATVIPRIRRATRR